MTRFPLDVVVMGGCGHVGFPLGLSFASRGLSVVLYDVDECAVERVNGGHIPFTEEGAQPVLDSVLGKTLEATTDPAVVGRAEHVVVVIGTPVDEHLNPNPEAVPAAVERIAGHLVDGQLLVLRSTVFPGVTEMVENVLHRMGKHVDVAFCPERIAQGKAMTELFTLPQLIAARTPKVRARASALFSSLTDRLIELEPEEAELGKLFTNVWRYIKFAAANQLFMIANDAGLDYDRIRKAIGSGYPRADDLPGAGFAAGPCLFKDTMQLASFDNNNFTLGHDAMLVNEGLPLYLVSRLEKRFHLQFMTVGILGMAFKPGTDDIRSSLSYKLKRVLRYKASATLCTDPYVATDPDLRPLDEVVEQSDILVLAVPHPEYAGLHVDKPLVDIWNLLDHGVRV